MWNKITKRPKQLKHGASVTFSSQHALRNRSEKEGFCGRYLHLSLVQTRPSAPGTDPRHFECVISISGLFVLSREFCAFNFADVLESSFYQRVRLTRSQAKTTLLSLLYCRFVLVFSSCIDLLRFWVKGKRDWLRMSYRSFL